MLFYTNIIFFFINIAFAEYQCIHGGNKQKNHDAKIEYYEIVKAIEKYNSNNLMCPSNYGKGCWTFPKKISQIDRDSNTYISRKYKIERTTQVDNSGKISDDTYHVTINLELNASDAANSDAVKRQINECISNNSTIYQGDQTKMTWNVVYNQIDIPISKIEILDQLSCDKRANSEQYPCDIKCSTLIHELLHLLGLPDVYPETTNINSDCRIVGPVDSVMYNYERTFGIMKSQNPNDLKCCCPQKKESTIKNEMLTTSYYTKDFNPDVPPERCILNPKFQLCFILKNGEKSDLAKISNYQACSAIKPHKIIDELFEYFLVSSQPYAIVSNIHQTATFELYKVFNVICEKPVKRGILQSRFDKKSQGNNYQCNSRCLLKDSCTPDETQDPKKFSLKKRSSILYFTEFQSIVLGDCDSEYDSMYNKCSRLSNADTPIACYKGKDSRWYECVKNGYIK